MVKPPFVVGLRVDILDNEGIWNTGIIVDVDEADDSQVEVKYDGWGEEFNEWINLSSQRLAPFHMFTQVRKCWAKLNKWPWWPAFVVLRAPTTGDAINDLNKETKLYVEFFDAYDSTKRAKCWMQRSSIVSFEDDFDERASKHIGKNFPKYVAGTKRAKASAAPLEFCGKGTLPIEFSNKCAQPLARKMQGLSENDWNGAFQIYSNRYLELYGYKSTVKCKSFRMQEEEEETEKFEPVEEEEEEPEDKAEEYEEYGEPGMDHAEEETDDEDEEGVRRSARAQKRIPAPKRGRGRPRKSTPVSTPTRTSTRRAAKRTMPAPAGATSSRRRKAIDVLLDSVSPHVQLPDQPVEAIMTSSKDEKSPVERPQTLSTHSQMVSLAPTPKRGIGLGPQVTGLPKERCIRDQLTPTSSISSTPTSEVDDRNRRETSNSENDTMDTSSWSLHKWFFGSSVFKQQN